MKTEHHFGNGKAGAAITVRVTPRAGKNEITGILEDGTIKIKLKAPPVDGAANAALIQYLADVLEIAPSNIEVLAGTTSRTKLLSILGIDSNAVQEKILAQLG